MSWYRILYQSMKFSQEHPISTAYLVFGKFDFFYNFVIYLIFETSSVGEGVDYDDQLSTLGI